MKKLILLFLTLLSFSEIYSQSLMVNKSFFEILKNINANDISFYIRKEHDTSVYCLNGDYNKPSRFFYLKNDTCVKYTIVFHKKSSVSTFIEYSKDKVFFKESKLFQNPTGQELVDIFMSVHPNRPLTEKETDFIEEQNRREAEKKLIASIDVGFGIPSDSPSNEELLLKEYSTFKNNKQIEINKQIAINNQNSIKLIKQIDSTSIFCKKSEPLIIDYTSYMASNNKEIAENKKEIIKNNDNNYNLTYKKNNKRTERLKKDKIRKPSSKNSNKQVHFNKIRIDNNINRTQVVPKKK